MGIDARMFAMIRGTEKWLKPEEVLAAARDLASTFEPENFLITKGDPAFERPGWGPTQHALSIVAPLSPETAKDYERPDLAGKVAWLQDGEPEMAEEEEQFVEVHLMTRYYGPGYERGDWLLIRGVAEWLEARFPGCEVWYGGDSSGVCAERMGPRERAKMTAHFLANGHRPYHGGFGGFMDRGNKRPTCPTCEVGMNECGGGQGKTFWFCQSCHAKATSSGEAETFLPRGKDFFDADVGAA